MRRAAATAAGVLLAAALLAGCSNGGTDAGRGATTSAPLELTPFTADDAKFRASFPAPPKRTESEVPAAGQTHRLVQYAAEVPGAAFAVGWFQLQAPVPPDRVDAFLEGAMNNSVSAVQGALRHHARIDHKGHPAMDYRASMGTGGVVSARMVLVGRDAYVVQVTAKHERAGADFGRFADAFEPLPR